MIGGSSTCLFLQYLNHILMCHQTSNLFVYFKTVLFVSLCHKEAYPETLLLHKFHMKESP